ncbi:MAG TPA: hypothetical protein VM011_09560 [Gammaproteobacteria bacterium]|nr:hypothetical protein [Gammaproteobacteria bacterium]
MIGKYLLAGIAVFALWSGVDFLFHGMILADDYRDTAELWRPAGEAKMGLHTLVVLLCAMLFSAIYALLVSPRSIRNAVLYGALFGAAAGISSGYGMYAFMPLPHDMAVTWLITSLVEGVLGGLALGFIMGK